MDTPSLHFQYYAIHALTLYRKFILHKTLIILITVITSTIFIIYILWNHQYDRDNIDVFDIQSSGITEFFAANNENIRSFGYAKSNDKIWNEPIKRFRRIKRAHNNNKKKNKTIDPFQFIFNNTWFIMDNISMYENKSEILAPTHLNFTTLKQRYNTYISSLKALKNINGIINDINPNQTRCKHKGKVFSIGINKSGTTSINAALELLGYSHNNTFTYWFRKYKAFDPQRYNGPYFYFRHFYDKLNVLFMNKYLMDQIMNESFYSYNFGDSPYCFLYEIFDKIYPNSKYILTRRASTWSIVNSNMKYASLYGAIPTCQWEMYNFRNLPAQDFANWIAMRYELHNQRIIDYFTKQNRLETDLLILDLENITKQNPTGIAQQKIWRSIMEFLGCNDNDHFSIITQFPHKNAAKPQSCDPLPKDYKLDWKTHFNHTIPLMYQYPPSYIKMLNMSNKYGPKRPKSVIKRRRYPKRVPYIFRKVPMLESIDLSRSVQIKMLNESIEHLI